MGQSHTTETKPVVFESKVAFPGGVRCECIPAGNLNGCQHCRPKLRPSRRSGRFHFPPGPKPGPKPPFWMGTWPPIRPAQHVIRTGTSRRPLPLTTARKLPGTTARKHMVRGPPRSTRRNQRTGTGVPGE